MFDLEPLESRLLYSADGVAPVTPDEPELTTGEGNSDTAIMVEVSEENLPQVDISEPPDLEISPAATDPTGSVQADEEQIVISPVPAADRVTLLAPLSRYGAISSQLGGYRYSDSIRYNSIRYNSTLSWLERQIAIQNIRDNGLIQSRENRNTPLPEGSVVIMAITRDANDGREIHAGHFPPPPPPSIHDLDFPPPNFQLVEQTTRLATVGVATLLYQVVGLVPTEYNRIFDRPSLITSPQRPVDPNQPSNDWSNLAAFHRPAADTSPMDGTAKVVLSVGYPGPLGARTAEAGIHSFSFSRLFQVFDLAVSLTADASEESNAEVERFRETPVAPVFQEDK